MFNLVFVPILADISIAIGETLGNDFKTVALDIAKVGAGLSILCLVIIALMVFASIWNPRLTDFAKSAGVRLLIAAAILGIASTATIAIT